MIDCKKNFIQCYCLFVISALTFLMGTNAKATSPCNEDFRFKLVQRDTPPADGWPEFVHEGKQFKFHAPAPAIPVEGEWREWSSDIMTFQFAKLRNRKVLFAYELSDKENNAEAVFNALKEVVQSYKESEDEVLWTAVGVKYDTTDMIMYYKDLYERAIVPFKWSKELHEFIKSGNDPEAFAELVGATVTGLPSGAHFNLNVVKDWSAVMTRQPQVVDTDGGSLSPEAVVAYRKMVEAGPCNWLKLKPVASFIAVNHRLDIKEVKEETLLTSHLAW